jgi:hypothetical protein
MSLQRDQSDARIHPNVIECELRGALSVQEYAQSKALGLKAIHIKLKLSPKKVYRVSALIFEFKSKG